MCSQYDRGSHGSSSGHLSPGDKVSIFDTWGDNPLKIILTNKEGEGGLTLSHSDNLHNGDKETLMRASR